MFGWSAGSITVLTRNSVVVTAFKSDNFSPFLSLFFWIDRPEYNFLSKGFYFFFVIGKELVLSGWMVELGDVYWIFI